MRALLGMTQPELGKLLGGLNADAISRIERGDNATIGIDLLGGICNIAWRHGINLDWLLVGDGTIFIENAHKRPEGPRRDNFLERQWDREAADVMVGVYIPGQKIIDPEGLPEDWRELYVPVIGHLAAGDTFSIGTEYAESTPPGWADAFVEFKNAPPGSFALRVKGDSMAPKYVDGDIVIIDPRRSIREGLACAIYEVPAGVEVKLKLVKEENGNFTLSSINPAYKPILVPASAMRRLMRIMAVVPKIIKRTERVKAV